MRLERKRSGKTLPTVLGHGEVREVTFDGYHVLLRAQDSEGRELRVTLERHEAERIARYVLEELRRQRARVDDAAKLADQLF